MPKNIEIEERIQKKLDYIGLDLDYIPRTLKKSKSISYKTIRGYDEKKYTQYKYIDISDIEILLSPTTRVTSLKEKFEKAEPLYSYLDTKHESNAVKHTEFLKMLNKVSIRKIEEIANEQKHLMSQIPFKVKFKGNYLWQIYYSEISDRYFMIVPTRDADYSTFFYLLKKKIEDNENDKIFVPISCVDYEGKILSQEEIKDLENYLWLFTKDYPSIYEVWDRDENVSLDIIGETQMYETTKTLYKVHLTTTKKASKFSKLLKALFILQTELPHFYKFKTNIDKNGNLEFYLDGENIKYEMLGDFIKQQYAKSIELTKSTDENLERLKIKLNHLQVEEKELEDEYMAKEKQITTFLECKKTFFGKVRYFFRFGKKNKKIEIDEIDEDEIEEEEEKVKKPKTKKEKLVFEEAKNHTLYELELSYKKLETKQEEANNLAMDINALKLKNKNLKKKIENASNYIEEINKHKKSIFEFWRYSNKDAVAQLEEGEEEELSNKVKLEKVFNYEDDFEDFGNEADKLQRNKLTDDELESVFIANTNLLPLLNRIYLKTAENKEISEVLKSIKSLEEDDETYEEKQEEVSIFGRLNQASNKERTIANKVHREQPREKIAILEVKKDTKGIELKKRLISILKNLRKALKKIELQEDIYVYKAVKEKLEFSTMEKVSLDCEQELNEFLSKNEHDSDFYLYKLKLPKGTNYVAFTNIIFYDNKNMTLPVGMNLSSKILINLAELSIESKNVKTVNKLKFEDEEDDFSSIIVDKIEVNELNLKKKVKKNAR